MSKANNPQTGLTRRGFLKTTAALTGAAAIAGGAGTLTALAEEETSEQTGEQTF
ncbi:MAG: twin-arginine translocation signal domain-containing protein, partial [Eggerthellales bacterium]|nr:twin-arginine translocation signal domain-containing protein [Eggerthellales bacterium]